MMQANDLRLLSTGKIIPTESYCDQPYLVKTDDGAWLCCVTTGVGKEGEPGQTVITIRSEDQGETWSQPVFVEPVDGPEASYAVMLKVSSEKAPSEKAPSGRVYIFYNHNGDNIRQVPADVCEWFPDGICKRVDSLGYYVLKYSDDHGRSWSASRYPIPIREMDIDRHGVMHSRTGLEPYPIRYFWNVGKPFILQDQAFISLHKVGGFGEGFFTRSEGVLLRSANLLTESDPSLITWETLPEGDFGLRAPKGGGPIAEEQSYVVLSDGSFFSVYRTVAGYPACAYSRDEGRTWTQPDWMRYIPKPLAVDGRRMKHPRAANFAWKCSNGKYLYWFHNHGGRFIGDHPQRKTIAYNDRNPAWLCGGVEVDTEEGKVVCWSQPEILLYDDDPFIRTSYPDMLEDDGMFFLSETQKNLARIHELDPYLLEGVWGQFGVPNSVQNQAVQPASGGLAAGETLPMPELPEFSVRDHSRPDHGSKNLRAGLTIEFLVRFERLETGKVVVDQRLEDGKGLIIRTSHHGSLEIILNDGRTQNSWSCDPEMIIPGRRHHVAVTVDAGPRAITWIVDGILCDGGDSRQFGWGRFSPHLTHVNGNSSLQVYTPLEGLWIYNRALKTSEVVGNYRWLASES